MPNLSIKNVPPEVVEKWRQRAVANHRSLQGELLAMVTREADATPAEFDTKSARHARQGHKSIELIAAEHRERNKRPIKKGERAVGMIRADRDQR